MRGIPLSVVEEESAEISRRINQAARNQTATTLVSGGVVVHPVTTEESSLSQIPGNTILVQTTSTGKLFVKQCLKNNNNFILFLLHLLVILHLYPRHQFEFTTFKFSYKNFPKVLHTFRYIVLFLVFLCNTL